MLFLLLISCRRGESPSQGARKLNVVATLFPVYDFARIVGGDRVDVRLILPPGMEPHDFEPRPEEVMKLSKADLFIFTNRYMEPWAARILKGVDNRGLAVIDASAGVALIPAADEDEHEGHHETAEGHHHHEGMDPHIWLSIANAIRMVDTIREGLAQKDPAGSDYYRKNAEAYRLRLEELARNYREGLANCGNRTFLHGGHYAFGYLAKDYGLRYLSAYAISPNAEPTPGKLVTLVRQMKQYSLRYVFYEELLSPRVAETIARETGANLLKLHGIHNVTRQELNSGVSYLALMTENLKNLRTGMECK
jgi:zinc transport system substrate-binding protein